jgi:hypothetical protein
VIHLRIFVSSPGDVGEERRLTRRVIERLQQEWNGHVTLQPVFWEHEPLRATAGFQEQLPLPSQSDVVICILWARLGTRLPKTLQRPDGSAFSSGTEFEFEDAFRAYQERGVPDLLVYRKTSRMFADLGQEEQVLERLNQKKALDAFVDRWFRDREGSFTAAFHSFDSPAQFLELVEEHLRKVIEERLRRQSGEGAQAVRPLWPAGSPFRGLHAFDFEHASLFCGRAGQVADVLHALRRQAMAGRPFVMILGGSGSGKSSLARAGILPELTEPNVIEGIGLWRWAVLVPGNASGDLLGGLAQALLDDNALQELRQNGMGVKELGVLLHERPETAVPIVRSGLSQAAREVQRLENLPNEPAARLVILVDQLEEVFTSDRITSAARERFDAALAALVSSGVVWVLCTLRSDFYAQWSALLPRIFALKEGAGQYDLLSPGAAEIGQMIRQPARMAGLRFEEDQQTGERLDDILRDAAVREPAVLPLLEFTLDELYKRRTSDGLLTLEAYRELGGVEGALAHRAEEVFAALPLEVQNSLPRVLSALVSPGAADEGTFTRRRAPLDSVTSVPESRALVEAFIAARLLATDRTDEGTPVVSVTHEALLHRWPRAQQWLRDNEEQLRARAQIKSAAALWKQEREDESYLLPEGRLLRMGESLLTREPGNLSQTEARLLRASLAAIGARQGRKRRNRIGIAAAAALLAVMALVICYLWVWEHVEHYSDFARYWGEPKGVGAIASDLLAHRRSTLRFHRKGRLGRVVKVEAVDGSGALTPYIAIGPFMSSGPKLADRDRECAWSFDYDGQGRLKRETAISCSGNEVYEFEYKGSPRGNIATGEYTRDGVAAPLAGSGAAQVKFERTPEGLDRKVWYVDNFGTARQGRDGSYGHLVEDFDRGLPTKLVNLGADGYPAVHPEGYVKTVNQYDGHGWLQESAFYDRSSRLVLTKFGGAKMTLEYDKFGNARQVKFYDEHQQPMPGIASWKVSYGENGQIEKLLYLDSEGKPAYNATGSAGFSQEYKDGRIVSQTQLDGGGKVTAIRLPEAPPGVAGIQVAYDKSGNMTALTYVNKEGMPVAAPGGAAKFRLKYDDQGNPVEARLFRVDGKLISEQDGFAIVRNDYDNSRNLIEEEYFDEHGRPVRGPQGVMKRKMAYDRGQLVEERYYDGTGEPMASSRGEARYRKVYFDADNIVETYYNLQDQPQEIPPGYASKRYRSNHVGKETEVVYFDDHGKRVLIDGCDQQRKEYDFRGNLLVRTCFNRLGGKIAFQGQNFATVRFHYDELGRRTGESFYGPSDAAVVGPDGVFKKRWSYPLERRDEVEESYLTGSGQPASHPSGYVRRVLKYGTNGKLEPKSYFGPENRPVNIAFRFATDPETDWSGPRIFANYGNKTEPALTQRTSLPLQQQKRRASVSARPFQRSETSPGAVAESDTPRSLSSGRRIADPAAIVSDLVMLTERIRDQYKDYLEQAKREPQGEEEQMPNRLAELDDAASAYRKVFRRATGEGGGFRNWLGLNKRTAHTEAALRDLEQEARNLAQAAAAVEHLARRYPLGPVATASWRRIKQDVRQAQGRLR